MILKHSKTKWIDIEWIDGVRLNIDYPTQEQMEQLRELFFTIININGNYTKEETDTEIELTPEQKAKELRLSEKIAKLRIKFSVKGWEGVKDEDGNDVKLKLVSNEMENDLFESFISNLNFAQVIRLGNLIQKETEFNEADKKK